MIGAASADMTARIRPPAAAKPTFATAFNRPPATANGAATAAAEPADTAALIRPPTAAPACAPAPAAEPAGILNSGSPS